MKIGGICGECGKYYQGEVCPENHYSTITGSTLNTIMDIPEHFNRGLGERVRGRAEYRAKLKEKGLIEVGNEKKHVDPVMVRKLVEKRIDKSFEDLKPEAYRILSHYEGDTRWN